MRKNLILIGDVVAFGGLISWFKLGFWIDLLGFSTYHSRGDVWLPTPPAAINFLMGMVSTAAFLFGAVILLTSGLIFVFGRSSRTGGGQRLLSDA
jgi:hypothetical protein